MISKRTCQIVKMQFGITVPDESKTYSLLKSQLYHYSHVTNPLLFQ